MFYKRSVLRNVDLAILDFAKSNIFLNFKYSVTKKTFSHGHPSKWEGRENICFK